MISQSNRAGGGQQLLDDEQLRRVMSLLPMGVYTCDTTGRITFWNRRAAELWGDEPNAPELREQFSDFYELLSDGAFIPRDERPMALALSEGRSFRNLEVVFERRDGERFTASLSIDPIRD